MAERRQKRRVDVRKRVRSPRAGARDQVRLNELCRRRAVRLRQADERIVVKAIEDLRAPDFQIADAQTSAGWSQRETIQPALPLGS